MVADCRDGLIILANTHVQIKFLLHSLEPAAKAIGLYVNLDKTQFMFF